MDEHTPPPDYIKGFNEGYMMAKYEPDLTEKLITSLGNSDRSMGFKDGKAEYEADKTKEDRYPSWLRSDRLSSLDKPDEQTKDTDKDRNIGDDLDRE